MSRSQDTCNSLEPASQILFSWIRVLETAANGMGDTVSAVAEHAAVSLWRCSAKLPMIEMKIARALSASAVLAFELDRNSFEAGTARSRAILAVDTLALLSRTQPNDLAQLA